MLRTAFAAVVVFALTSPAFAASDAPPSPSTAVPPGAQGWSHEKGRMHRFDHLEQRVDRAVSEGRLSAERGQKLKSDVESVRAEVQAERTANGGKLTPQQKEQVRAKLQAVRDELRATAGAPPAPAAPPAPPAKTP